MHTALIRARFRACQFCACVCVCVSSCLSSKLRQQVTIKQARNICSDLTLDANHCSNNSETDRCSAIIMACASRATEHVLANVQCRCPVERTAHLHSKSARTGSLPLAVSFSLSFDQSVSLHHYACCLHGATRSQELLSAAAVFDPFTLRELRVCVCVLWHTSFPQRADLCPPSC